METIEIKVEPRDAGQKGKAKRLRHGGKIPGIFYGPKTAPVPFQLDSHEFRARISGSEGSHLIRMASQADVFANKVALVKDIQFHPISGAVQHVDLYEVNLSAKITVEVPLHFVGKAAGVVRGGILQPIAREVEVECLPLDIPKYIDVDVSGLDIGHSMHISDLVIPAGVSAIYETDFPVVSVVPPTVEKAPVAEVAPTLEGAEAAAAGEEKAKEEGAAS
jgi:large subunit ribosomal protein L25